MDNLRWILLGVGIVLVIVVYLWGRSRKKGYDYSPLDAANDVPSFSAKDQEGDWVDGVGPVRVVTREEKLDEVVQHIDKANLTVETDEVDDGVDKVQEENVEVVAEVEDQVDTTEDYEQDLVEEDEEPEQEPVAQPQDKSTTISDVISLYVVADRSNELKGEQILSATFAAKLEYGDMNIFHRLDANDNILFSMANMMEPGWFDYDKMHNIKTRGITLFTQLKLCDDPVHAVDEMLICAHTIATMLGAQLCDQNRQLLNEAMAKSLREKAKYFADLKKEK